MGDEKGGLGLLAPFTSLKCLIKEQVLAEELLQKPLLLVPHRSSLYARHSQFGDVEIHAWG
jgi:hypothetical protein